MTISTDRDEIAPVIFLNFNRPAKTKASLEGIRKARPKHFFVFADGPRPDNCDDKINCGEVRRILSTDVDWTCKIWRFFPESNMGCGVGVASAISVAFNYFESAIILEDDCIAGYDFFSNSSRLLADYAEDESVGAINGNNFQDGIVRGAGSYYRSKYFHCWGWATWRRTWKFFDYNMTTWNSINGESFWDRGSFCKEEKEYWGKIFQIMASSNRTDIWDFQFTFALFANSLACLTPNKNLVKNIGFGLDATHTVLPLEHMNLGIEDLALNGPVQSRYIDLLADQYTFWKIFSDRTKTSRDFVLKGLQEIEASRRDADVGRGLAACSLLKSASRIPGLDLHRAKLFLSKGYRDSAVQALREESRWFPANVETKELLEMYTSHAEGPNIGDNIFRDLYSRVNQYTMLGPERLYSLYTAARQVCETDQAGDFVECGVAAGGSTLLLGLVIKKFSKRDRHLHSFDTFEGMPRPSHFDKDALGVSAQDTHWGEGTCSSPMEYVEQLLRANGIHHLVRLQKGLFKATLPEFKKTNPNIALLHMDGDWYHSTNDILVNLYDSVSSNGWIQIDDYGHWAGCKLAVDEFLKKNNIQVEMTEIDYSGRIFRVPNPPFINGLGCFVNIGCGGKFEPGWKNFDSSPQSSQVEYCDVRAGIPIADETADVVYSSHFIEHLSKREAEKFLDECFRILKSGGLIRIVFSDLEIKAREYLKRFELASYGGEEEECNHEWMIVEMIDQIGRHCSGGEMIRFFSEGREVSEASLGFIEKRVGRCVRSIPREVAVQEEPTAPDAIGRFRLGGEIHRWMYDTVSLKRLLRAAGFFDVRVMGPESSRIPNFRQFKLDANDDGTARKPDSSFVEAAKRNPSDRAQTRCAQVPQQIPSCFSTIATKAVASDLKALLASMSLWMRGARIYVFSDSFSADNGSKMPFAVDLDVRWIICLDEYSSMNRTEMEQKGLWSDFQLMKPKSMLHAFENGEKDVMFLDADIFLMGEISLIDYAGQDVSLSRHHIMKEMETKYGEFNGGTLWACSPEVIMYWMSRFPHSRYYDQACLEDVYDRFDAHVMHEGQNISPYRIYRAPENPALIINRFSIQKERLYYRGIPVQFIHTHLGYKEGYFGAFNELVENLSERLQHRTMTDMIRFFRNLG